MKNSSMCTIKSPFNLLYPKFTLSVKRELANTFFIYFNQLQLIRRKIGTPGEPNFCFNSADTCALNFKHRHSVGLALIVPKFLHLFCACLITVNAKCACHAESVWFPQALVLPSPFQVYMNTLSSTVLKRYA